MGTERIEGPRGCHASEFDEVMALINDTFRAGIDQDIRTDYPLVFNEAKLDLMRILKVDGKVIAHVPVAPREVVAKEDAFTIGIISPTITHPDYRKRGYATRCLGDCVRIMEEQGWPVSVLWTLEATFPFYQQAGWEAVGSQGLTYWLDPADKERFDVGSFEVQCFDPSNSTHIDLVAGVHDAEPYHIRRSAEDYKALLILPKITTFLTTASDERAYLVYGEATNKPGLIEGGGDPAALEALVGHILREHASETIQAWVNLSPSAIGSLLETKSPGSSRPVEHSKGAGHQMMRVNRLTLLLERIQNHLGEKGSNVDGEVSIECEELDECVTIAFADGSVDLSSRKGNNVISLTQRQVAQLIFGGHDSLEPLVLPPQAKEILDRLFPYYFPIWGLDHS